MLCEMWRRGRREESSADTSLLPPPACVSLFYLLPTRPETDVAAWATLAQRTKVLLVSFGGPELSSCPSSVRTIAPLYLAALALLVLPNTDVV